LRDVEEIDVSAAIGRPGEKQIYEGEAHAGLSVVVLVRNTG